jgi:ABC-2 type transport system permease protein
MGRLLGLRRSIGLLVLTGSIAPILLVLAPGRTDDRVVTFYNDITVGLGLSILFPVAALIVATAALGEERKSQTLPFLLLKPVSRWVIALAVVTAAALASFVILQAGVLASWIAAGALTGEWSIGVSTTVAAAVQSVASAALFVPLGLVLGRAALVGLGYLMIWEVILANVIEGIQASSIYRIVLSAWADVADMTPDNLDTVNEVLGRVEIGLGGAVAKATVLLLISVAVTGLLLRRRDLVPE